MNHQRKATDKSIELRAKPEMIAMVNAAKDWMKTNENEDPEFYRMGGMIFNDNAAADKIEHVITDAG